MCALTTLHHPGAVVERISGRHHLLWAGLLLIFLGGCEPTGQNAYPSGPITFIVPSNPGSSTDTASRTLTAVLQDELGQPVNVSNRTGGGGIAGHLALRRAPPDGYTLGAITVEITMMHWTGLTSLEYTNYTPLALVTTNPGAITVRSDAPWQTVNELLAAIKETPGAIMASGSSHGGIWDLCRIEFLEAAGLPESGMPWIPSQGAASALKKLLAGDVNVVTAALTETNALRKTGQVRTLAVMAEQRLPMAPDVQTLKELGIDYVSDGDWMVVAAPEHLPETRAQLLRIALRRAFTRQDFKESMQTAGYQLRYLTGSAVEVFLEDQDNTNGLLMDRAGLTLQ